MKSNRRHPDYFALRESVFERERTRIQENGPPPAPWEKYPGRGPIGGWNQGEQGYFLEIVFLPWWRELQPDSRTKYLEEHAAPDAWVEYLGKA